MVENLDEIFYEINQGYAADFLPFLLPFHTNHLEKMNKLAREVRKFVLEYIIEDRYEALIAEDEPQDYVECLIKEVRYGEDSDFSWNTALFALEDVIGGHCAITNFLVKVLAYLVKEPQIQKKIQEEIDAVTYLGDKKWRGVAISDRNKMPFTEGTIFEAIRMIASAIVPRVSNQDSSVNGYRIKKDTLIFLDNYDLSMSEELWDEPHKFKPDRFIVNGHFVKPNHFLPFGGGRRGCMGYKMVQLVGFGMLTNIMQHFTVLPANFEDYTVPVGSLALPFDTYSFNFVKRGIDIVI
ncbi:Cytochrome P450 [Popillia japonica]|uniref:Cytochrome P450 n=1 Tax=Popillia japonica TaxID=7064 RepID=A0AAW1LRX8_POPJA